jgi:nucleoporin NUP82
MARVAAEGLQWLSKPSTGYDLFTKPTLFKSTCTDTEPQISPKRLAATRGSELFFGCGNEVRCADLQDLKARHPDIAVVAEGAKKVGHREHKVCQNSAVAGLKKSIMCTHDMLCRF